MEWVTTIWYVVENSQHELPIIEFHSNRAQIIQVLDLVYNPTGVHLPPPASKLQSAYKKHLKENYGIHFDKLICITNMPINRFYDHLNKEGKLDEYMDILVNAFNPLTFKGLMCRDYLNVSWDGRIFDCDFNAQLEMPTKRDDKSLRISDINSVEDILKDKILTDLHCYGCTAGQGSS